LLLTWAHTPLRKKFFAEQSVTSCRAEKTAKKVGKMFGGFKNYLYLCNVKIKREAATRSSWSQRESNTTKNIKEYGITENCIGD
jgi:hypothetical protein